jgi:regulator of sigma E protease
LGLQKTGESLTLVFRFLQKLMGGQVSAKSVAGPVSIAKIAYYSAADGWPDLLIFLTILSANLAVINFLPIPLLDGGHMVFLILEGLRGRPVAERILSPLLWLSLFLLLGLMLFALLLDVGIIARTR